MDGVRERIDDVLAARRRQLPTIEREIARWHAVRAQLDELAVAVDDVLTNAKDGATGAKDGESDRDVAEHLDLDVAELDRLAAQSLAALATARARLSRHTINIGVSGRARNGKSTLLQSLSGLDDRQIPTGRGQPVTAVRSRIYHAEGERTAQLTLHTERSFCEQVLAPYFPLLALAPTPRTLGEFLKLDLQALAGTLDRRLRDRHQPYLARLQQMQDAVDSYRPYLTGEVRDVPLAELRRWVAYPGHEAGSRPDRRYLAVREAVIRCPFPQVDVSALGLVDLPGLGELVPNAEEHHLAGLENDVDFVIIVKRPTDTTAMWAKEDQTGLDLIGQARGAAALRDFMVILVNTGGCSPVNVAALDAHIRDQLNDVGPGADQPYEVWHADAADPTAVSQTVMLPILRHLAASLPRMDAAVIEAALRTCAANQAALAAAIERTSAALRAISRPTATEELISRAADLQDDVAEALQGWIAGLHERAGDGYEDAEFLERVVAIRDEVREWVLSGFGVGQAEWTTRALREMRRAGAAAKFATDAVNAVRNEIFRRFGDIDDVLAHRRTQFWSGLVEALGPQLAHLMPGPTPQQQLTALATRLREAPDPCPHLAETVDLVLDIRLDYRTRLMPSLRRSLEVLRPEVTDARTGEVTATLLVPISPAGAEELFVRLCELARQAVHDAGRGLENEPQNIALALLAYGEQFEDSLIRAEPSDREFRRLVSAYRDELWPQERSGPATATARVQRVVALLRALTETLSMPGELLR